MFSDTLRKLRKERNLTQRKLADMLVVDCSTVTKWETGKAFPDYEKQHQLADIFNVSLDYLLGRTSEPVPAYNSDTETEEYLEALRTRPEMKMLFNTTKNATKEEIEKAVAVIEALLGK